MINNNMEMLKQMKNLSDYAEYLGLCDSNNIESVSEQLFYTGTGTLQGAILKYPNMEWQEAYIAGFNDIAKQQNKDTGTTTSKPEEKKKSSCCGGKTKKQITIEPPTPTLKGKFMLWSYKNISKCLFCAGMRLGLYIGMIIMGVYALTIGG